MQIKKWLAKERLLPNEFVEVREVEQRVLNIECQQNRLNKLEQILDHGVMVTCALPDHTGKIHFAFASTPFGQKDGLKSALARARFLLAQSTARPCRAYQTLPRQDAWKLYHQRHNKKKLSVVRPEQYLQLIKEYHEKLSGPGITYRQSSLAVTDIIQNYYNTLGTELSSTRRLISVDQSVFATHQQVTEKRSLGNISFQGDIQDLHPILEGAAARLIDEANQLARAPLCPTDKRDLLLAPDQMMLQIHESIGHPLELDRILGEERNYAGGSFIKLEDFGKKMYGSTTMNISVEPNLEREFCSYPFDDFGDQTKKVYLIKNGLLVNPLGAYDSIKRVADLGEEYEALASSWQSAANARAESWYRVPIDRMGNLNLEAGAHSKAEMISHIEKGIFLQTNASWSIDDQRDKFQFGCELGHLIENGKIKGIVRSPQYRDRTPEFWHKLARVGDASTFEEHGTPYCGKGEPNQMVKVGHASPLCHFTQVDIFPGA
jgi:predicted Zn-dependent protease